MRRWWPWIPALIVLALVYTPLSRLHYARRCASDYRDCLSNMRVLAMAMNGYCSDNDGRMPLLSTYPDRFVPPGAKLKHSLICPADPSRARPGYAFVPRWAGVRLEDIEQPSCAVLLYDADGQTPSYRHWGEWPEFADQGGNTPGLSVGYCDGHVLGNSARQFTQRNVDTGRDDDYLRQRAPLGKTTP